MKVRELIEEYNDIIAANNKEKEAINLLVTELMGYQKIYLHYDEKLNSDEITMLKKHIEEYIYQDKPVQYILGYTYFYGMKLFVTPDTLIPRFDTERVVEEGIKLISQQLYRKDSLDVVDIGCGSGAIALALKKEFGNKIIVDGIDISDKALEVSVKNSKHHNLDINFICNDLLTNMDKKYDVIISNPPYISKDDDEISKMGKDVLKYEPHLALFANDKGMHFYRQILKQSFINLKENGIIIFEIGYNQEEDIMQMVKEFYPNAISYCLKDYNNNPRVYVIIT